MKEQKRIFINELPETATKDEIQTLFQEYGNVKSIDIKERKDLGARHKSLFFAYINLVIDEAALQKCFTDFRNNEWHGQHVELQLAKESFLDRLKREREENKKDVKTPVVEQKECNEDNRVSNVVKEPSPIKRSKKKVEKQIKYESKVDDDENLPVVEEVKKPIEATTLMTDNDSTDYSNIIIKNNKGIVLNKGSLTIPSVGNSPIVVISKQKNTSVKNQSEANLKRLESLNKMKKGYQTQKMFIQAALADVDNNKKTFFEEAPKTNNQNQKKKSLFAEEDDDPELENFNSNFDVREPFQGKSGQKLLDLQMKYKNDKRFALDERFLEGDSETKELPLQTNDLDEEKRKELEILEEVLGKKIRPLHKEKNHMGMIRYDPSNPEHTKYEVNGTTTPTEKKKKRKRTDTEENNNKIEQNPEEPHVTEEKFYEVANDIKEALQSKANFSLLNTFSKHNYSDNVENEVEANMERPAKKIKSLNGFAGEANPFKYDSSDDEDETTNIPDTVTKTATKLELKQKVWNEPFFFSNDDYRLQEGLEFLEKMKCKIMNSVEFGSLRKDIKKIVRAKVRNHERKNKPFKRKLGGNRQKKLKKIQKALNK